MADEMLRIAGRGDDGLAKAIRTDENGNVNVKMSNLRNEKTDVLESDYANKIVGSTLESPHKAYIYGGTSNPDPGTGGEFSQDRYDRIKITSETGPASNSTRVENFFAQQLFTLNVLEYYKRAGDIPTTWTANDLKKNTHSLNLIWSGYGTGPTESGVIVKYFIPSTGEYSQGKSHNESNIANIEFNFSELNEAIDEDGNIHFVAQTSEPSDGTQLASMLTRYVKIESVFWVEGFKLENIKTKIEGSVTEETKTLFAEINEQTYSPSITDYGVVVIQNLSKTTPIEVVLNGTFKKPSSTSETPNPEDFTNVHRIYPGQVLKFRKSPEIISYRSTAGHKAKIKISCGYDMEASALENKAQFSDMQTLRFFLLCADRHSNKVISHQGSNLYFSADGGNTWELKNSNLPSTPKVAFYTKEGTLIIGTIGNEILRSEDDGETTELIKTETYAWRGTDGIAQDSVSGRIVFGENNGSPDSDLSLWSSTDDGRTWQEVLNRTISDIRHWHSVQIDPYTSKWLATSGDFDAQVEWWESEDGENWTAIVGADSGVPGTQMYRTLGVFFTQDEYKWATDNPLWGYDENFMVSAKKDSIGVLSKDFPLSGPGYAHVQFPDLWIVGTQPEGSTMSDRSAKIYISKDNGKTWSHAFSWLMRTGSSKGGFTWASLPDSEGNIYIRLANVEGTQNSPWWYGTLKLIV